MTWTFIPRLKTLLCAAATAAAPVWAPAAAQSLSKAQESEQVYPSRPIRYIVASAPGGIADITPRVLGPRLSEALGQPVVVENRPAGGIVVGGELVAKAAPDGYTLLSATPQVAIVQSMVKDLAFDPRRDLAPVALVGVIPNVLVAGPRTTAKTLAEILELARRNPGKLNYSSTGAGTSVHLSAELLKYYGGVDIVHVPYRGAAAAMTALLAGDVDMMVDSVPPSLPHIRAGKVRALAVTSARRVPQLSGVPTMIESGYPDFEINGWTGVVTTAGTPSAIIARLEAEIGKALARAETAAAYEKAGLTVRFMGAAEFGKFWDAEIAKFALAIKHSGAVKE
jgi:tripartite-type tricarboxylate transporter receptor subunit TctC